MLQLQDFPRRYLPRDFDCADAAAAAARFDELERRPLPDLPALQRWLADFDELATALDEARSLRQVASTRHTDDPAVQEAFRSFVERMDPLVSERSVRLESRLLDSPHHARLDPALHGEFLASLAMRRRLFRPENIPLEVEETGLTTDYQKIYGATTIEFEGKTHTLPQMALYSDDLDRRRRESAWRAGEQRIARDGEDYEKLLDRLVELRTRMARNAGCRDYVEYRFLQFRRPYSPEDCRRFHDSVEKHVIPLLRAQQAERRKKLGLASLRPWDLQVDLQGRPPLRPFRDDRHLIDLVRTALEQVDAEFGRRVAWMDESGMLDLGTRKGKAPGGYMCTMNERRVPFIFMNAAGLQKDVNTLLHECGHAFHSFETRHHDLCFNRGYPIEFAEVASMSMELVGLDRIGYSPEDKRRACLEHLESVVRILAWVATIDSFQLDFYARPAHTRDERRAIWLKAFRRFRGDVDYAGLEEAEAGRWRLQPHIYANALYYIEYAIAQLGALQVWRNCRKDPARGIQAYRNGLRLGFTRPLPQLFEAAGAHFDFSEKTVGELMRFVQGEIEKLR